MLPWTGWGEDPTGARPSPRYPNPQMETALVPKGPEGQPAGPKACEKPDVKSGGATEWGPARESEGAVTSLPACQASSELTEREGKTRDFPTVREPGRRPEDDALWGG